MYNDLKVQTGFLSSEKLQCFFKIILYSSSRKKTMRLNLTSEPLLMIYDSH